jgi:hypothetical protein
MTVYVVQQAVTGAVKVGRSDDVAYRFEKLKTGSPYELTLIGEIDESRYPERWIHRHLKAYRMRGEWFEPAPEMLEFLAGLIEGLVSGPHDPIVCEVKESPERVHPRLARTHRTYCMKRTRSPELAPLETIPEPTKARSLVQRVLAAQREA